MGFFQKVTMDCGFPLVAYMTHDFVKNLSHIEGAEGVASFKATAAHVIKK